jgi:hypothetical protein
MPPASAEVQQRGPNGAAVPGRIDVFLSRESLERMSEAELAKLFRAAAVAGRIVWIGEVAPSAASRSLEP